MGSFRKLLKYMRPYLSAAVLAPLLMAMEVAMDLAQPRLLQEIIDVGVLRGDLDYVFRIGLVSIGVALLGAVGGVGCTFFATIAGVSFGTDIREGLYRKVQSLSFGNLDRLTTGRLITRLTGDVEQVQQAAMMLLRVLVRAPLLVIGSLIMAILTSPRLSLLLLLLCPLLIALLVWMIRTAHPLFAAVQDGLDRVNTVLQENLAGVRVVKAFVRSDHESKRFADANDGLMMRTVRASTVMAVLPPFMMLLLNLGVVGIIWFGGLQVKAGHVQLGQILAFINYLLHMLTSLMMVGMLLTRIAQADASADRIVEVLNEEPEINDRSDAAGTPPSRGRVEFDAVGFSYAGSDGEPVLRDVSFVAEPGETVAILGMTGSGKSTLVHLVPRLYDVTKGRVLIDGIDVRDMQQDALRQGIGIVPQETVLFSGTVRENIRYGRPDASDRDVKMAARMAEASPFIADMADGYDTALNQRGVNLSGGQKQRLAIARALCRKPSVLILDDCTSAVDVGTETRILKALDAWDHPCTRLVIAQRIGSVMNADRIIVLDGGTVAAQGTHDELMETSRLYRDIVESQQNGQAMHHG